MSDFRIEFRRPWECDHKAVSNPNNNFDICYGCGQVVWKCKIDVEDRIEKARIRRRDQFEVRTPND